MLCNQLKVAISPEEEENKGTPVCTSLWGGQK
jgi:hypothetical protein